MFKTSYYLGKELYNVIEGANTMKLGRVVKTAIKWGPVVLPVIMKFVSDKKQKEQPLKHRR